MRFIVGPRPASLKHPTLAVIIGVNLIGCGIVIGRLGERNRDDFPRLREGMTSAEVIEIMGTHNGIAPQPWRCQASHDSTGASFHVWYYVLENPYERDEREYTAPIVVKEGVVLGIGWDFLDEIGGHFKVVGARNRRRIRQRLRNGMSKEEIVYQMSHAPPNLGSVEDRNYGIPQPYRALTHRTPDGGLIEIWYYLVDYPTMESEMNYLTPIVLKDGVLIGRGWDEARDIAGQYDIEGAGWRWTPETVCPGRNTPAPHS